MGWDRLVPNVSLGQLGGQGNGTWDVGWDRYSVSLGQLGEKGAGMWDVGWDSLVPKVSLDKLGDRELGQASLVPSMSLGQKVKQGTGTWDRLPLSMSLSHSWRCEETGTREMGQGMGQFGTLGILGWWDSSQGVTASPAYADHIRAELTRLSPPPAHGGSIHGHPSQILRQQESRWVVYESASGWFWGPQGPLQLRARSIPCWGHPGPSAATCSRPGQRDLGDGESHHPVGSPSAAQHNATWALPKSRLGLFISSLLFQAYYVNS